MGRTILFSYQTTSKRITNPKDPIMFKSQYKTLFQGSECPKFSLSGWKNMFQTLTFRAQECSRFALSGKRMFPTLTLRVEESSRFSPSGLKNAQDSRTFRVEVFKILTSRIQEFSRFSLPGSKNVQDSHFQDPRMFKILTFSLEEECLNKILCFREETFVGTWRWAAMANPVCK